VRPPCEKCGRSEWRTWGVETAERCAECERRRSRARRKADPAEYLYQATRRRAREAGLPHSLTRDDVDAILAPWACEYCSTPVGSFTGGTRPNSATLDRLVPSLGYVRSNVVLACHKCNCEKSEHTPQSLRAWAHKLELLTIQRLNLRPNA
jgi:hypothetical protein